jgi:hypothetical protein
MDPRLLALINTNTELVVSASPKDEGWTGEIKANGEIVASTNEIFGTAEDAIQSTTALIAETRNVAMESRKQLPPGLRHYAQGDRVEGVYDGAKFTGIICGHTILPAVGPRWIVALDHRITTVPYSHIIVSGQSLKILGE